MSILKYVAGTLALMYALWEGVTFFQGTFAGGFNLATAYGSGSMVGALYGCALGLSLGYCCFASAQTGGRFRSYYLVLPLILALRLAHLPWESAKATVNSLVNAGKDAWSDGAASDAPAPVTNAAPATTAPAAPGSATSSTSEVITGDSTKYLNMDHLHPVMQPLQPGATTSNTNTVATTKPNPKSAAGN